MEHATIEDFMKLDLRVGKIVKVEDFPEARKPTHKLWVDLGPMGVKPCAAQIAQFYSRKALEGRMIVCVTNFPPRRIAGFSSEVMLLAADLAEDGLSILQPDRDVPLGTRVR